MSNNSDKEKKGKDKALKQNSRDTTFTSDVPLSGSSMCVTGMQSDYD